MWWLQHSPFKFSCVWWLGRNFTFEKWYTSLELQSKWLAAKEFIIENIVAINLGWYENVHCNWWCLWSYLSLQTLYLAYLFLEGISEEPCRNIQFYYTFTVTYISSVEIQGSVQHKINLEALFLKVMHYERSLIFYMPIMAMLIEALRYKFKL